MSENDYRPAVLFSLMSVDLYFVTRSIVTAEALDYIKLSRVQGYANREQRGCGF